MAAHRIFPCYILFGFAATLNLQFKHWNARCRNFSVTLQHEYEQDPYKGHIHLLSCINFQGRTLVASTIVSYKLVIK